MDNNKNYCVIMGGGSGRRFWPFSRKQLPKQFLDFFDNGRTLLQQAYDRYREIIPQSNIFVTTNIIYRDIAMAQLPELSPEQFIFEPTRKSTAPGIAWACSQIRDICPDANIVIAPCDHLIRDEENFSRCIRRGLEFVSAHDCLLTLGIKPDRPVTGYGYLQVGDEEDQKDFYRVKTFVEKPEIEFARTFVDSGEFYWNSGIFLWNVKTIMQAYAKYMPMVDLSGSTDTFSSCPNISIDYGIMEMADNVCTQLCDFGWADVGTWESLYELTPKDDAGNAVAKGQAFTYDSHDNMIAMPEGHMAVIQGLEGYVVTYNNGVLLICKKDEAQSVRKYYNDVILETGERFK